MFFDVGFFLLCLKQACAILPNMRVLHVEYKIGNQDLTSMSRIAKQLSNAMTAQQ